MRVNALRHHRRRMFHLVTDPAAALLGDLGARVVKIEAPPDGDPTAISPRTRLSANFAHQEPQQGGRARSETRAAGRYTSSWSKADVFLENFRPAWPRGWGSAMKLSARSIRN